MAVCLNISRKWRIKYNNKTLAWCPTNMKYPSTYFLKLHRNYLTQNERITVYAVGCSYGFSIARNYCCGQVTYNLIFCCLQLLGREKTCIQWEVPNRAAHSMINHFYSVTAMINHWNFNEFSEERNGPRGIAMVKSKVTRYRRYRPWFHYQD